MNEADNAMVACENWEMLVAGMVQTVESEWT